MEIQEESEGPKGILEMNIATLVRKYPRTREVLARHFGPGCFDCPAFGMETVLFACSMHQVNPLLFARDCQRVMREAMGESLSDAVD